MPPRVATQTARTPQEVASLAMQIAGFLDDPAWDVRVSWGAYSAGTRKLTMQVVDRLKGEYSPHSFQGYKCRAGTRDGRWLVCWYVAATKFGTPVASAGTYSAGKQLADWTGVYLSETDEDGKIEVDVSKGAEEVWVHAGVPVLLRSRGVNWTGSGGLPSGGDPGKGEGTSGGGEIVSER